MRRPPGSVQLAFVYRDTAEKERRFEDRRAGGPGPARDCLPAMRSGRGGRTAHASALDFDASGGWGRTERHLGGWAVRSATAGSQDDVGDVWGGGWRVAGGRWCMAYGG